METLEKIFAAKLLKVKAIKLQPTNPFTWASGWKSPFYCDNRKTLSYPELRNFVKIEIGCLIAERFPEADAIAGVATGAIPQGALVADLLNLPFVYVRSKPKDHGLENLIEGELRPGMKVVVVEDLISTGGSSLPESRGSHPQQRLRGERHGGSLHLRVRRGRPGFQGG